MLCGLIIDIDELIFLLSDSPVSCYIQCIAVLYDMYSGTTVVQAASERLA